MKQGKEHATEGWVISAGLGPGFILNGKTDIYHYDSMNKAKNILE